MAKEPETWTAILVDTRSRAYGRRPDRLVSSYRTRHSDNWVLIVDLPSLLIREGRTSKMLQIFVRDDLLA